VSFKFLIAVSFPLCVTPYIFAKGFEGLAAFILWVEASALRMEAACLS
jgi:hypothetical protein